MEHTFKSVVGQEDNSLGWNFRIIVPEDIMDHFKGTDRRVICTVNNSHQQHCALLGNGDGRFFVMFNKAFRKKYDINSGDEVLVKIWKDESKYGMAEPDFFEELCFQDPVASRIFHDLTAGKQRTLLHLIIKVKSEEKQLEKALIIFDYIKMVDGNIDFKEVNEALKNNKRFKQF